MKEEREATHLVGAESLSPRGVHSSDIYWFCNDPVNKFLFAGCNFKENIVA